MILTTQGTSREAARRGDRRSQDSCSLAHPSPVHAFSGKGDFAGGTEKRKPEKAIAQVKGDSPDLNATPKIHAAEPQATPELKQTLTCDPWAVMPAPCSTSEQISLLFPQVGRGTALWGQQPPPKQSPGTGTATARWQGQAPQSHRYTRTPPLKPPQTSPSGLILPSG